MKRGSIQFKTCALLWLGLIAGRTWGLETDQFTPPPQPLVDISPQLQQHVTAILQQVVARTNARYLDETRAAAHSEGSTQTTHENNARACLTDDCIAEAVNAEIGPGLVESALEVWVVRTPFPHGPAKFDPPMGDSVYGGNPIGRPLTLQELSPTINLFGIYMGTDKIGHLAQQGYEYYRDYRRAERNGADEKAATRTAIEGGIFQERNYYGLLTVGVYSNADLASNYAGLKFYINLTRPVTFNGLVMPSILVKRQNLWDVNPLAGDCWLKPFFTQHYNESFNPSRYSSQLRNTIHENFPDRAMRWASFYHTTREAEIVRQKALTTFCGEDYGHDSENNVSVAEMLAPQPVLAKVPAPAPALPAERAASTGHTVAALR